LFAVRVDAMGTLLRDYHTAQVPSEKKGVTRYTRYSELAVEDLNTILSSRDFRCDAAYTVAISFQEGSAFSAQMLADALRNPVFVLYLGRKSCPLALPLQPKVLKDKKNYREALESHRFSTDDLPGVIQLSQFSVYWEDGIESGYDREHVITRRDAPLSRKRWQFAERRENYTGIKKEG